MLRITTLVLAGALVAGCQESDLQQLTAHHGGVQGEKSYGGDVDGTVTYRDHAVYGDPKYTQARVSGDKSYGSDQGISRSDVSRSDVTRGDVSRSDISRSDVSRDQELARTDTSRTTDVRQPSVRTETVTNTPTTPSEARTSADVRAPADVRADLQKSADARASAELRTPDNAGKAGSGKADPERMAFASTARFPTDMRASDDLRATAMITHDGIKIANATDQEIKDAKLWIDGTYVTQVNSIPAHSVVTVKRTALSDHRGNLPSDLQGVKQLQLETHANLYNLQGPVFENR
jgi:hypothetical protein